MKCDEWQKAISDFINTLPAREHEWENISACAPEPGLPGYEDWICRHCLKVERRTIEKN